MVIDNPSDTIPATSLKLTGNNEKIPEPDTGQMNFTGLSIIQTPTLALFIVTDGHWLWESRAEEQLMHFQYNYSQKFLEKSIEIDIEHLKRQVLVGSCC